MKSMMSGIVFLLFGGFFLVLALPQALAAVSLASPEQDRHAKQAVPPSGKALIYVYRLNDARPQTSPGLWLNKRASGQLEPRTYGMWAAGAGRLEVRAGRADATPLTITCETGRIYFVRLTVNADDSVSLRQVPYGTGRTEVGQARLVLDPATAARMAAAPMPATPVPPPPAPVKETPVATAAPATRKVQAPKDEPAAEDTGEARSGVTLILKGGSFQLANDSQIIALANRSFSAASLAYGLEGEWRLENGFAFGGELFGHSQDYTTTGSTAPGDMTVIAVFLNAKKYFRPGAVVQPYIGVGIGSATTDFSGAITGTAAGYALQGMTGVAFRWRHVGIYTELKYAHAETEGTNTSTGLPEIVDASGIGLFAGMSVHF